MSLKIGNITCSNVLLAPMAGVTDLPFRNMVTSFNNDILTFSEMISSEAIIRHNARTLKMVESNQKIHAVQIAGSDPAKMAESAQINESLGANLIDINMGCPAKKIVNNYAGSWLMRDEKLAIDIIKSVVNSVKVPVTLKMRLGWSDENKNAPIIAKAAEESGIQMISIHGRTRCQMYSGIANWKEIKKVKIQLKHIPLICNGDITSEITAKQALEESEADGIMIGRGAIGKPWLIAYLSARLNNTTPFKLPSSQEILDILLKHLNLSVAFYGEDLGIKNFRKHLLAYTKGFPYSAEFRNNVLSIDNKNNLITSVKEFFNNIEHP